MKLFPFPPNWANKVTLGEAYLTQILSSPTGAEQRIMLRITPRRDYEFSILASGAQRPYAETLIKETGAQDICVPIWIDAEMMPQNEVLGSVITVKDIGFKSYKIGSYAAFIDAINPLNHDFVKIIGIDDDKVTLERSPMNFSGWVWVASARAMKLNLENKCEVEFVRNSDSVYSSVIKFFDYGLDSDAPDDPDAADAGYLIYDGLAVNQYAAKDGVLPARMGTAEGQLTLMNGMVEASSAMDGYDSSSALFYRNLYLKMFNALGLGNNDGAVIRQAIPSSYSDILMLNDLFLAGGDIPSQSVSWEQVISVSPDGSLKIPPNLGGDKVTDIIMVYPKDSRLDALSRDATASGSMGGNLQTKISKSDWKKSNGYAIINIPNVNDGGNLNLYNEYKVAYIYDNSNVIPQGSGIQVFPSWNPLPFKFCIFDAGLYKFFDLVLNTIKNDNNVNLNTNYMDLLLKASRNTLANNLDVRYSRSYLKKSTKINPIHTYDEFNGTYCYSGVAGEVSSQGADGNPNCLGFKRWVRDQNGLSSITIENGLYGIGVSGFFDVESGSISAEVFLSRDLADGESLIMFISNVNGYQKDAFKTVNLSKYGLKAQQINSIDIPLSDFSSGDAPPNNWDLASDLYSNFNLLSSRNKTINSGIKTPFVMDGNDWGTVAAPCQIYNERLVW